MSKRHFGILAILLAGAILAACAGSPMALDRSAPQIAVYFSPQGGCTDAIVGELDAAKESFMGVPRNPSEHPLPPSFRRHVVDHR